MINMFNTKNIIYIVIVALLIIGGIIFLGKRSQESSNSSNNPQALVGKAMSIEGKTHVPEGTKVSYNSNPPTSGDHWPRPADWGFYNVVLPDELLVHNLEHGGIWISYKDIDFQTKSKLENIARIYPQAVIVTSRQKNDNKIVLASWGRLDKHDLLDEERIERFIKANINKSPEPQASLEQPKIKVGEIFPDFEVTEVSGTSITRDSLRGKPAIVWFTTSWCVPCQIGARDVSKLDNELGGKAFNVLVIFVDLSEKDSDLINWRKSFANEDWMVAFDNELTNLAKKAEIRFLDSKFLLDKNGVIKNIDFKVADQNYLNTIERIVKENT